MFLVKRLEGAHWLTLLAAVPGRCLGAAACSSWGVNGAQTVQTLQTVHNQAMKTETTRVMVPISPEVKAVFERLAAAQGCTVGRAISEWLTDTLDGAVAITDLVEKARKEPLAAMRQMHSYALGLGDMTTEILDGLRKATSKTPAKARQQPPAGGSAGAAAAPSADTFRGLLDEAQTRGEAISPPVSNTGGKLPSKPQKRSPKARKNDS